VPPQPEPDDPAEAPFRGVFASASAMLAASIADELDGEDLCAFAETLVRFFTTSRQKGAIRDTATNVRPEEFRVVWGKTLRVLVGIVAGARVCIGRHAGRFITLACPVDEKERR
jgi:hypothetical protein